MRSLQKGSVGDEVKKLQREMKKLGLYNGKIDGDFGLKTRLSVIKFQQQYFVDGIADEYTQKAIFQAVEVWKKADRVVLMDVPKGIQEIEQTFGHIEYEDTSGGYVKITNDFIEKNIVTVDLPVVGRHQVHRKLQSIFENALREIRDRGLDGKIDQFGTFCPRHKMHNPRRGLSTHSWGIACDINWATNMPGQVGDL